SIPPSSEITKLAALVRGFAGRLYSKYPVDMLRRRLIFAVMLALFVPVAAGVARDDSGEREEFGALVARVRRSDASVDFDRLRRLAVRLATYSPDAHSSKPLFAALNAKDYAAAKRLADAVLAEDYLDVDAHFVAAIACAELGDSTSADHHAY